MAANGSQQHMNDRVQCSQMHKLLQQQLVQLVVKQIHKHNLMCKLFLFYNECMYVSICTTDDETVEIVAQ